MKEYDYIIFDIDDTLLDYQNAETHIMKKIFEFENKAISDEIYQDLWDISCYYWDKYELDDSDKVYVQENYHTLFYEYLRDFMQRIKEKYCFESTTETMQTYFLEYLKLENKQYDDTESVLQHFSQSTALLIASNGLDEVQQKRIEKYKDLFSGIFISEELGIIKPSRFFWDRVFENIDAEPEKCLMVGDSLKNDIISAACYGMDTCWVNRKEKKNTSDIVPTYEVRSLVELLDL